MKGNRIKEGIRFRKTLLVLSAALALGAIGGIYFGFSKLHDIWIEQCQITNLDQQVIINAGKMVKADVIAEKLGLKEGANLALIDFAKLREEALKSTPTLRDLRISRRQSNKVVVTAEERVPVAKMSYIGRRSMTGRVVDDDGVVFVCQRGTQMLPTIRESRAPGTSPGKHLIGRAQAALTLIKTCRDPRFQELGILEINIAKPDFLLITLGDYSRLKLCWDDMDKGGSNAQTHLERQLTFLLKAMRSQIGMDVKIWNATIPDTIFADTQEKL